MLEMYLMLIGTISKPAFGKMQGNHLATMTNDWWLVTEDLMSVWETVLELRSDHPSASNSLAVMSEILDI